jgi:hypothetical protein
MPVLPTPLDLTTTAAAKIWAAVTGNNTDDLVQQLVTAASQQIISYIGRNPLVANYTEVRDGNGNDSLSLWNWPVISVSALTVANQRFSWGENPIFPLSGNPANIAASVNAITPGFIVDSGPDYSAPSRITLVGFRFTRGRSNVTVKYQAGYSKTFPEAHIIATGTVSLNNAATFIRDGGVVHANGTPFVLVASAPAAGQYTVSAAGVYGFNAADNTQTVTITYQFGQVPYDLVQACNEIVGQDLRRRSHIDEDSIVVAAQNTNFSRLAIPRKTQMVLDTYRQRMVMA